MTAVTDLGAGVPASQAALSAGAVELERRAAVVDRLRDADRDVARVAADPDAAIEEIADQAEADANAPPEPFDRRSEIPDDIWFELMAQMEAETDYDLIREVLREDTERLNE